MSAHPIVHIEIASSDPKTTADFFSEIFEWKIDWDPNFPDYIMFDGSPGPGGGFPKADNETYKNGDVVLYIDTEDIDATLAKIASKGGKVVMPKSEIPGIGWMAFFTEPAGTRIGLFTSMRGAA